MRQTSAMILLLSAAVCTAGWMRQPATRPQDLAQLAWITGSWVMEKGDLRVEEHWTEPRAGTMFGVGRTMKGDRTVFFEFLRIESTPDGIVYFASPRGRAPATPFKAVEIADGKAVFENPDHDFPNRVTYWRAADGSLAARVDGKRNGRDASESWLFRPAAEK